MRLWCVFILLLIGCNEDNGTSEIPNYNLSLETWESAKARLGNTYEYSSEFSSVFGFGSITSLEVRDGMVIGRKYQAFTVNQETLQREITTTWTETETELGDHPEGAPVLTIDEIYTRCRNEVLSVNRSENFITFQTENEGILSLCTYVPKNCLDDCAIGYNIVSISWPN